MAIIDMGDVQELVKKLNCEMRSGMPHFTNNTAQSITAIALVAIAEQLAEANGYLAAISKRMDQVYERTGSSAEGTLRPHDETKYGPQIRDCFSCDNRDARGKAYRCSSCEYYSNWEPA